MGIRRAVTVGLLALLAQVAGSVPAAASSMSDRATGSWVDQTLTIWYNTQSCSAGTGYQPTTLTTAWVRRSTYATIGDAPWALGWFGQNCSTGGSVATNPSGNLAPVSWTSNNATRSVSLNIPMTVLDLNLASGAWVKGKVMYRNQFNQYLCTALSFGTVAVWCP